MASENKEIGDIVKKCKILLLDIEGTTTSISFVKDKLFPYAEENVKQFLEGAWDRDDVKEAVTGLRKLALEDKEGNVEGVVEIPSEEESKEAQIEGVVNSVKWLMAADRKVGPLKQLQGLIWKQGYDNGDIKGHVYDDVSPALEQWQAVEDQKVYIYSSGSVQAQKLLFGQSLAGDLLRYIDGHFDTAVGAKQEPASYTKIVEKIGCKADEILFLTDIPKEAEAATSAGVHAALLSRAGNAPLPAAPAWPVLHSLAALTRTNKRKPDSQEEIPAKIPKKAEDEDVKSTTSDEPTETPVVKEIESTEKMEVEEETPATDKTPEDVKKNVIVEKPTDSSDDKETPVAIVANTEPVIKEIQVEKEEKTEEKETEKMEVENEVKETIKNGDETPTAQETPPTVEIKEVTDGEIGNVADIIEGLEPVVEEPESSEEMQELQNVGDVLEKECDEILSKVQDVTNLVNIPVKPLLNSIVEETMETENTDSNDIVDRILDTELDLDMKKCEDIDLNTVSEIAETENKVDANGIEDNTVKNGEESPIEEKNEVKEVSDTKSEQISEVENVSEKIKVGEAQNNETEKAEAAEVTAVAKAAPETVAAVENNITEESESAPKEAEVKLAADEVKPAADEVKPVTEVVDTPTEESKPATEANTEKSEPVAEATPVTEEVTSEESKPENDSTEPHVNGKSNGDGDVAQNGDASKEEELSARLSENGNSDKVVNGSNGDSMDAEQGQGDCKVDAGEIKVKTVTTDEPPTDPIEQPTEA